MVVCRLISDSRYWNVWVVFNSKVGAWSYNFFHLRGLAILLYLVGLWMDQWYVALGGIVLFGHIAFDRMLG